MFEFTRPQIKKGDKLIIGLGDSYTQGTGAYTEATWAKNNYKIPVHTHETELLKEQFEGSWVNQLCQTHMPGWVPVNLGHAGIGNRASIKEIYLNPEVDFSLASDAIVVYMLSGLERFDFIRKEFKDDHFHFESMWPNYWDKNSPKPDLWKAYATDIHSSQFMAMELMLNLFEAVEICKARGWKLIIANAFDCRITKEWMIGNFKNFLYSKNPQAVKIINNFDWDLFAKPNKMDSFLEYLLDLEGRRDLAAGGYWTYYTSLDKPSKYITNCAHPTRDGHTVIAELLYNEICLRKYIDV